MDIALHSFPRMSCRAAREISPSSSAAKSNSSAASDRTPQCIPNANGAKKELEIDVIRIESTDSISSSNAIAHPWERNKNWKTRWLRFGPLSGLFSIFVACCSMLASLAILAASHHSPTADWSHEPSTYLAVCTAVANQSLRYATIQGVIIAWWTRALQGSTLSQLHLYWHAGNTIRGAVQAGRSMGVLGLASIFSTLVAIDGPLLQRASSVVSAPIENVRVPLNVIIAPEIPTNWTGAWTIEPHSLSSWNETLPASNADGWTPNNVATIVHAGETERALRDWQQGSKMQGFITGCPGKCQAKVVAPALFEKSCKTTALPVDYSSPWKPTNMTFVEYAAPLNQLGIFVSSSLLLEEKETINLVTGFATTVNCKGNLIYTACSLESAVGEYDVTISGDEVTLNGPPTMVALANNTKIGNYNNRIAIHNSPLGGIVSAFLDKWLSFGAFYGAKDDSVQGDMVGLAGVQFLLPGAHGPCPSFRDPHDSMMEQLDELMFRIGYTALMPAYMEREMSLQGRLESSYPTNSTVLGTVQGIHNIFRTEFRYFAAAAVVELVCIAFILPTYVGWWKLGRDVSMSPLEIAKAFEAPMLNDCHSNATGREIAREAGEVKVRYGMRRTNAAHEGRRKLALTQASTVESPGDGFEVDW